MIRVIGEPDDTPTVHLTMRALDHIKGTERWLGFLIGVAVGGGFAVLIAWVK